MSKKQKRYFLPEDEIPRYWYNIQADMKNKPLPPLNPQTKQPLKAEDNISVTPFGMVYPPSNPPGQAISVVISLLNSTPPSEA